MDYKLLDIGYEPPLKKTILVVDDESALQSLIFDTFADNFKIVTAHNGRDGLAMAEKIKPDIILLDVMMPGINGIEVMKLLQAGAVTKTIPVIITTAKGFDAAMVEMLKREPNVAGFLPKPFHVVDMRETVRQALEKKK